MLTERRKADRETMMAGVEALLQRLKVPYRHDELNLSIICPRRVSIELMFPRGLRLTVNFNGDSPQPDVFVLSWHVSTKSRACLSDIFDSINNYHFQKATDIATGYERLLWKLESRILAVQDGSAFSLEREKEYRRRYEAGKLPWQSAGPAKTTEEWAAMYEASTTEAGL